MSEHESPIWYDDQVSFMPDMDSPKQPPNMTTYHYPNYSCKKEQDFQYQIPPDHFLQLPLLESPKLLQAPPMTMASCNSMPIYGLNMNHAKHLQSSSSVLTQEQNAGHPTYDQAVDQSVTDWRVLDKFVASQLSHEDVLKQNHDYSNEAANVFHSDDHSNIVLIRNLNKQEMASDQNASTSTSSCQIDLWK